MQNDLRAQLFAIWSPEIGSIWRIKNHFFWASSFAREKDPKAFHPGLVIDESNNQDSFQTAPGTSRFFSANHNIFQACLKDHHGSYKNTYFLLHLSVPIHKKIFHEECHRGWWDTDCLEKTDILRLRRQLELRNPYDQNYS